MARNPIQFQDGMSLGELTMAFGTEEQCEAAVRAWRWPSGFVCPRCGGCAHTITGERRLHECHTCRLQTSLKAGTIFEHTLIPLTKWFQAMWLITQSKDSISTLSMARQLDLKWDSAWLLRQKLAAVMAEDEASRKLDGRVEMDDAVLGGERHEHEGGKRGRSGPNKVPFVVAVATSDEGRPQRLLLHVVRTHDGDEIEKMAAAHLAPTARIVSDGLGCFRAVTRVGCTHEPVVAAKTGWSETIPAFKWVNTVLAAPHQDCDPRNLQVDPPRLRAALPRRVPMALQPTRRPQRHAWRPARRRSQHEAQDLRGTSAFGCRWVIR